MGDPIQSSVRIRKAAHAISADTAIRLLEVARSEGFGMPEFGECETLAEARDMLRAGETVTFIAEFSYGWSGVEGNLESSLTRHRDVVWFAHTEAKYEWSATVSRWDGQTFAERDADQEAGVMLSSHRWDQICAEHDNDTDRVLAVYAALTFADPTSDAPQDMVLVT